MPSADTTIIEAGRHILRNLELGIDGPDALVDDAEDGQILGLEALDVRSVRDRKGATLQVINSLKRNELVIRRHAGHGRTWHRNLQWLKEK